MYGFSVLWKLFKSGLLATNAVAILHKQRFLRKCEHHALRQTRILCKLFGFFYVL